MIRFREAGWNKTRGDCMKAWFSYVLFLCAAGLIAIGLVRQEHFIVLKKAVNICLECIGVG